MGFGGFQLQGARLLIYILVSYCISVLSLVFLLNQAKLGFFVFLHFFLLLEELLDSPLDLLKGNYHFHKSYKD